MNANLKPSFSTYMQTLDRLPERDSHDFLYAYRDRLSEASLLPPCE